jgi:hypothetical protein
MSLRDKLRMSILHRIALTGLLVVLSALALLAAIGVGIGAADTPPNLRHRSDEVLYFALLGSTLALEIAAVVVIASVLPPKTIAHSRLLAALARSAVGVVIAVPSTAAVFCLVLFAVQAFQAT